MRGVVSFLVLAGLWLTGTVAADPRSDALDLLNQRNIRFNTNEFIDLVNRGDTENVRVFLRAGPNTDLPNAGWSSGRPVLQIAALRGYVDIVKTLVQDGALVNFKNSKGWTALHLACMLGRKEHEKISALLLENGADPNLQNKLGVTALHLAVQGRHRSLVEILLKHNADPRVMTDSGANALTTAVETKQAEMLALLEKAGYAKRIRLLQKQIAEERIKEKKAVRQRKLAHRRRLKQRLDAVGGDRTVKL